MSRTVEIESRRVLLDDVFRVEEAYLRHSLEDGSMSERIRRLDFERGDSVATLLLNRDTRSCVLAEQFRYPAYKRGAGWLLEIPAGIVERGEDPEVSVRREVLEEMGYRTGKLIPIAEFFPSPGGSSEMILLYCAIVGDADRIAPGGGNEAEHEAITIREIAISEIDRLLSGGRVRDGKTVVALTWLQLRLARGDIIEGVNDGPV